MFKLKKNGIIRIVATEAEAQRWEALGYKRELSEVQGENTDSLDSMDVEQLKEYAKSHSIDIGNSTSQNGILKKIRESLPATSTEG